MNGRTDVYLGTLETHHYTFTVFSTILIQRCFLYHFLSPYKLDPYLPRNRFAHAVHSDVTLTLVFFNNCRLTNVSLIKFEIKTL